MIEARTGIGLIICGAGIIIAGILIKSFGGSNYAYLGLGVIIAIIGTIILLKNRFTKRELNARRSRSNTTES